MVYKACGATQIIVINLESGLELKLSITDRKSFLRELVLEM